MAFTQDEAEILRGLEDSNDNIREESVECDVLESKIGLRTKLINILHINIRSIRKNFNGLLAFLEAYNVKYCDVIVLSESWQIANDQMFNIPGYTMFYNNADINKNDGTIVYIRSNLSFEVDTIKLHYSRVTVSRVKLNVNNMLFSLYCMYRPPSSSIPLFVRDVETLLSVKTGSQIDVLVGDININLGADNDNDVNDYISMLNHFGYLSAINSPTRVAGETSSILDHIFIKRNLKTSLEYSSYILKCSITDHYPVMLNINSCDNKISPELTQETYTSIKVDYQTFDNLISREDWTDVLRSGDAEVAAGRFVDTVNGIYNRSVTKKTSPINTRKKIKPWITNGIIYSIKKKIS